MAETNKPDINYKWGMSRLDHKGFWTNVSKRNDLTVEFIREFKDYLNWYFITTNTSIQMDKNFLDEFKDKIMWRYVDRYVIRLNEDLIRYFDKYVDWDSISYKKYLSDDFISKYVDKINWHILLKYRQVDEAFLEKFCYHFDEPAWHLVSSNQKLSTEFLEKYKDKLNWYYVCNNYKIPYYQRKKYREMMKKKILG